MSDATDTLRDALGDRRVLYVGGTLPTLSETFVWRELLALREAGIAIEPASVHAPQRGLGDPRLDRLADEAIAIYPRGVIHLLAGCAAEIARRPIRTLDTLGVATADALTEPGLSGSRRVKVIGQAIAGVALARLARRRGTIAHVHAHMAHVPATIAMHAARQLGATFSFTGHAVDLFRERTLLERKLRRAAFTACISRWHREFYRERVKIDDSRLPIVRCGVEIDPVPARSTRPNEIVCVGRLVPKKGVDLLIRAASELSREGVVLRVTIVGDGPERGALESLIASLGVGDRVRLVGAMPNDRVRDTIRESTLFVLPCRVDSTGDRDGIPVVLMEAMASGVCVVCGDLPTIRELVEDGRTGRLVTPDDARALADVIRVLLNDPARRAAIAHAGRAHVRDEFSLPVNIDRLARALLAAIAGRTPSPAHPAALDRPMQTAR